MRTRQLAEMALYEATRPRDPTVLQPRVEIHQQPNDAADAARLFGELKGKAEAEVLKAVKVDANAFSCVVHHGLDNVSDRVLWSAIFELNGKKLVAKADVAPQDSNRDDDFVALRDEMAKIIAREILNDAFMQTMRERWDRERFLVPAR